RQALKITVSEGIGTNKLVSQIASKLRKPAAFISVPPGGETAFLRPLANHWLPGIGPQTATRLNAAGLALIGQLAVTPVEWLSLLLGRGAAQVREFANGRDDRPVVSERPPARSYGQQETFVEDRTDEEFIEATLRRMADALMVRVRADGKMIRTVTVKVRYNDLDEDQRGESLSEPTDLEMDVYGRLRPMLRQAWRRRVSLRLVSLKFSNVYEGWRQMELLDGETGTTPPHLGPLPRRGEEGLAWDDRMSSPLPVGERVRVRGVPLVASPAARHEARQRLAAALDELHRARRKTVVFRGHEWVLRQGRGEPAPGEASPSSAPATTHPTSVCHAERSRGISESRTARPFDSVRRLADSAQGDMGREPMRVRRAAAAPYVPLHVHSAYSFLDSLLTPRRIVEVAARHGLPAVALTDAGNLHGAVEFFQAAREAGLKPIIGAEIRRPGRSVLLYVENAVGYRNLCRILTQRSAVSSQQSGKGDTRMSGAKCRESGARPFREEGRDPSTPSRSERDSAQDDSRGGRPAFSHDHPERSPPTGGRSRGISVDGGDTTGLLAVGADPALAAWFPGRFYDAATVAVPRIHYAERTDRWQYNIVQSMRTLTLLRQEHPAKRAGGDYHFPTPAELAADWSPEQIDRTREIADRCAFAFEFGKLQFPTFVPPDGSTPRAFLRRLVFEGLTRRYRSQIASRVGETPRGQGGNRKSQIAE
ncbi:PHP domain-containing protein, partial [bacterium]|nr:PHP domain-containing protein [bacterium]